MCNQASAEHAAEVMREEWRELGFYYEIDDAAPQWRFVGSRNGLLRFTELIRCYAANPGNAVIYEHVHYGPYMYLKLMTWPKAGVSERAIAGTLSDFARLADLITRHLQEACEGAAFLIGTEYAPDAALAMRFEVREPGFDPASVDPELSSVPIPGTRSQKPSDTPTSA